MQNIAPNPARLVRSPPPAGPWQGPHTVPCFDGITLKGGGSAADPVSVAMEEVIKYATASLGTNLKAPCFSLVLGDKMIYIPSRYRQIIHLNEKSVYTCTEKGYYLINLTVIPPAEQNDASVFMATVWTNDNRADSGATGHLTNKEVQATEPIYISIPCQLDVGQDVWCTLWHDSVHPLSPRSIDLSIIPLSSQALVKN